MTQARIAEARLALVALALARVTARARAVSDPAGGRAALAAGSRTA